jgi:hypothetical protein
VEGVHRARRALSPSLHAAARLVRIVWKFERATRTAVLSIPNLGNGPHGVAATRVAAEALRPGHARAPSLHAAARQFQPRIRPESATRTAALPIAPLLTIGVNGPVVRESAVTIKITLQTMLLAKNAKERFITRTACLGPCQT